MHVVLWHQKIEEELKLFYQNYGGSILFYFIGSSISLAFDIMCYVGQ